MARKSPPKHSSAAPQKGRGRPKNPFLPESMSAFRKSEITTLEEFEKRVKPVKKTVKKRWTNPVTSYQDYATDEVEFMNALAEYKRHSGRTFPTCREILSVLKNLGYAKIGE
jgi:hypothetical protein